MVDVGAARRIVAALAPAPGDRVLEIGPGRGALTQHLAGRVARLVAVELDRDLAAALRQAYAATPGVEILEADARHVEVEVLFGGRPWKALGNLPYNLTTPLLFWLLEQRPAPEVAVVMVQREVAARLAAGPGTKDFGALTVNVQAAARVERLFDVPPRAFRPAPQVVSSVVRLVPHHPAALAPGEAARLRALAQAWFGRRRQQLGRILRATLPAAEAALAASTLADHGIDLRARPEDVPVEVWLTLARRLATPG